MFKISGLLSFLLVSFLSGCATPKHKVIFCRDYQILGTGHIDVCLFVSCNDFYTRKDVVCPPAIVDPIEKKAKSETKPETKSKTKSEAKSETGVEAWPEAVSNTK